MTAINPLPTRSGKLSPRCCLCNANAANVCGTSLTQYAISAVPAANGAACPLRFRPGRRCTPIFRRWQLLRLWQALTDAVNQADRLAAGRPATPSLVCLDSQSVRLAPRIFEHRGLDGGKHVNGRKRQIMTDVQGRILACRVHAANGHDGVEALALLPARPTWGQRLVTVVTDKGYRGRFARHVTRLGLTHQIGSRPPSTRGFVPVAQRWVVERTFAWLTSFRRLAIDYEFTPRSHETWLLLANLTMCLNRLAPA